MRSVLVVVANIFAHQPFQVPFVKYNDIVKQVSATVADPALGDAILPWASEARPFGLDCEICTAIKDQMAGRRIVGKGLAQLLRNPRATRMPCHIAMENQPPVMRNDEETIENPNDRVGTVKKSIAAITSRWLFRNAVHRFAGSEFLGAFRIQRCTVLSEMSEPSIFSSP